MAADPVNFSFSTAEERLFVARARLPRLHQYIGEIMVLESHMNAAVQFGFHDKATDAPAKIAAKTIFDLIARSMLVEAAGVREKFDPAGFSLPTICDALDHPEVLKLLSGEGDLKAPRSTGPIVVTSPEQRQNSIRKLRSRFDEVERRVKKDSVLLRIRNYRNKYAAHPIIYTREERSQNSEFENPTIGEVRELIEAASEIIVDLEIASIGYTHDYIQMREISMVAPYRFYAGISYVEEEADRIIEAGPPRLEIPEETDIEDL